MNTTELTAAIRRNAFLQDADPDYTDAIILSEAYEQLLAIFTHVVTTSRTERWVQSHDQNTVADKPEYRIHPRAIVNGLRDVQLGRSDNYFVPLQPQPLEQLWDWEHSPGTPVGFAMRGDHIRLLPTPNGSDDVLRQYFYMRPPRLIPTSSGGRVVSVGSGTVTVNATGILDATGAAHAITGGDVVDVVTPSGGFELSAHGLTVAGVAGSVLTLTGDISRVEPGDFVRLADTSDYPQLPVEMHTTLAWSTASTILLEKGSERESEAAAAKASAQIARAIEQMTPRVKGKIPILINRNSRLRRRVSRVNRSW